MPVMITRPWIAQRFLVHLKSVNRPRTWRMEDEGRPVAVNRFKATAALRGSTKRRQHMISRFVAALRALLPAMGLALLSAQASANTLTQNVSWTIDRAGTSTKYRIVAYGDSIYAGYKGSIVDVAKYAAPTVDAEYLSALWNADIESVRRAKSGAVASDIYNNKIVAEKSYMQASSTRVVTFEMCGNDGRQARSAFKSQTGSCNYSGMDAAVNSCKTYVAAAMDF